MVYFPDRDPVVIERGNLVSIMQLVIKEVIDSSLKFGRQLESDHIPLQHFFIVLEHVLRHGMKPKKALIGPRKELWDILQCVEKHHPEAVDITASVRDLPTVKSVLFITTSDLFSTRELLWTMVHSLFIRLTSVTGRI